VRVYLLKRATIVAALCIIAGILAFGVSPAGRAVMAAAVKRDLPIYSVSKDYNVCSLTFDAAWGNEDTQKLIDILGKYKIKATFFVVGQWVDKYPESVKALSDAGHEVMNHSNTHPHMPQLSVSKMIEEIKLCDDKIEKVTGKRPFLFRPPYGDYDDKVVSTLRDQGHYTIQWDVDSLDWKELSAGDITDRVLKKVQPGSIILFHNAAKHTPEALPGLIESLIQKGYKFVPISELIYKDNFTINHAGKQVPNT